MMLLSGKCLMPSPKLNFGMKASVNHEGTRIHTNNSYSLIHSLSDVASVIIEIIHDELVGEVGSSAVFPACTIGSFEAERRRIHSCRFAA